MTTKRARESLAEVNRSARIYYDARRRLGYSRKRLRKAVENARDDHTLQEIGTALGMTRQGVYELLKR